MITPASILGKKIFMLTAHPDDESFLAAGTIHANKQALGQTFLVCATLGEKGKSHLEQPLSEKELQKVRHQELKESCGLLKVDRVYDLDFPDGGVAQHLDELTERASALITELQPEIILSFGPDGITGHNDHIAASKVAEKLAKHHKLPLVTFCVPSEVAVEAHKWLISKRKVLGHYVADFKLAEENICIPIEAEVKMRALKCYNSQIDHHDPFAGWPSQVTESLLEKECFYYKEVI